MVRGIYIHIPFCSLKCPYCDFVSFVSFDEELHRRYVDAVIDEIKLYIQQKFHIETIYFGGGTPSLLKPNLIDKLINFIVKNIPVSSNLEITMEINPNSYSLNDFKDIKSIGINRVSFGNQSFLEKNLKKLGRDHKPDDTLKSIDYATKSGIENINLDLIYGIHGQTIEELEKDLDMYLSLPIKHISAYMLTAYDETPFGNMVMKKQISLPDEDTINKMFQLIDDRLEGNGFSRYELSNWAVPGYECKHNLFYWKHIEFLGVGVSAWSFVNMERFGNTKNINQYLMMVKKGIKPVVEVEKLDDESLREEKLFLGLRLSEGIDMSLIRNTQIVEALVKDGYGEIVDKRFRLKPKGIMVINQIVSALL